MSRGRLESDNAVFIPMVDASLVPLCRKHN